MRRDQSLLAIFPIPLTVMRETGMQESDSFQRMATSYLIGRNRGALLTYYRLRNKPGRDSGRLTAS